MDNSQLPTLEPYQPNEKPVDNNTAAPTIQPNAPLVLQAPASYKETKIDITKKENKRLYKLVGIIAALGLLLWVGINYVLGFTVVNGISMRPTFKTNNVVLVWKLPVTWQKLVGSSYIPGRSNVIIVRDTSNSGLQYIKRVIALPYEHLHIADGIVQVTTPKGNIIYPDKASYGKNLPYTDGAYDGDAKAGQIYVMGDNRNSGASIDSRSSMGAIPDSYIIGRVVVRIWPLNEISLY